MKRKSRKAQPKPNKINECLNALRDGEWRSRNRLSEKIGCNREFIEYVATRDLRSRDLIVRKWYGNESIGYYRYMITRAGLNELRRLDYAKPDPKPGTNLYDVLEALTNKHGRKIKVYAYRLKEAK